MTYTFKDKDELAEFIHNRGNHAKKRRDEVERTRGNRVSEWRHLTAQMHAYWDAAELVKYCVFEEKKK